MSSQHPVAGVDVANLALGRLGQSPVADIVNPDPSDPAAQICTRWYDQTRREKLNQHIFNFARKTALLTPTPDAPAHPEFVNGYALPVDFVRLLTLGDRILYGGNIPTEFMDFSAGFLYCDDITDQGTGVVLPAPTLSITAIYRSGDVISGVAVPHGQTVIAVSGGIPIPGAQYQISAVVGTTQVNGNSYQIIAGTLSSLSVYFLQTTAGFNFDSAAFSVYVSGGVATPVFVPPGALGSPTGLEMSYVFDAQDVARFNPAFVKALWLQLAVNMCKDVTKKEPDQRLIDALKDADVSAAAVAGQEKPPRRVQRSKIRAVRRPGGIFRNNAILGNSSGF